MAAPATAFVVGAAVIAGCLACLEGPALSDIFVVPAMWIFSIAVERRFHRDLLHRRVPPFELLHDKHTVSHHDPRRMQRENLGVANALWDRVRGTLAR